jgi:hypothetical protein
MTNSLNKCCPLDHFYIGFNRCRDYIIFKLIQHFSTPNKIVFRIFINKLPILNSTLSFSNHQILFKNHDCFNVFYIILYFLTILYRFHHKVLYKYNFYQHKLLFYNLKFFFELEATPLVLFHHLFLKS